MIVLVAVFLGLALASTSAVLYFSVKKNLEFLNQQEEILEMLETSIRDLEVCYKRIDKKAKLELFSDDQTVKDLVDDMKQARYTVASIVERLTGEKEVLEIDKANEVDA